jgi:hypothetical protein
MWPTVLVWAHGVGKMVLCWETCHIRFVKSAIFAKQNKAMHNKMKCVWVIFLLSMLLFSKLSPCYFHFTFYHVFQEHIFPARTTTVNLTCVPHTLRKYRYSKKCSHICPVMQTLWFGHKKSYCGLQICCSHCYHVFSLFFHSLSLLCVSSVFF